MLMRAAAERCSGKQGRGRGREEGEGGVVWCVARMGRRGVPICCAGVARAERVNPAGSSLRRVWFHGQHPKSSRMSE